MRTYLGGRTEFGCSVVVRMAEGRVRGLEPRFDLFNHSPTGFEWGYVGSGPAQLALALLADAMSDDRVALDLHQQFKAEVVVNLPKEGWELTNIDVIRWYNDYQRRCEGG